MAASHSRFETEYSPNRKPGFCSIKKFDPNFSEIVFTDFCYALYGKAHDARGGGSKKARTLFSIPERISSRIPAAPNPSRSPGSKGSHSRFNAGRSIQGLETPTVHLSLVFESNYTEVTKSDAQPPTEMSYYVVERWELERKRDVLSPTPAQATALHCPRCGAPLQRDTVGACAFCGTKIDSGEFQWFVRSISLESSEARGPQLISDVEEVGTDFPTIVSQTLLRSEVCLKETIRSSRGDNSRSALG